MYSINRLIRRRRKKEHALTYIIIAPAAMHEGDVLSAPNTPQIIATKTEKKNQSDNLVFIFLKDKLRMPVTIATIRISQRNQNVVPSGFGC